MSILKVKACFAWIFSRASESKAVWIAFALATSPPDRSSAGDEVGPYGDSAAKIAFVLESEIANGVKQIESPRDIAVLLEKIERLQKFEADYTPNQHWKRQITLAIKRDVEKAAALDDETDFKELVKQSQNLKSSLNRLTKSFDEGEFKAAEDAVQSIGGKIGEDSFLCMMAMDSLSEMLLGAGRINDAEPMVRRLAAFYDGRFDPTHPLNTACLDLAGRIALARSDWKKAEALFSKSLSCRTRTLGLRHPHIIIARLGMIDAAAGSGDFDSAIHRLADFDDDWSKLVNNSEELRAKYFPVAVKVHLGAGRLPEAQGCQEKLVATLMKVLPKNDPRMRQAVLKLRDILTKQGKKDVVNTLDAFWGIDSASIQNQQAY
ncbi:MAG: tetratricopeptide repeat protein [Planctomycetia bacterium]